jgi:hypothetical protein
MKSLSVSHRLWWTGRYIYLSEVSMSKPEWQYSQTKNMKKLSGRLTKAKKLLYTARLRCSQSKRQ